jgi:type III pantothenate kinase
MRLLGIDIGNTTVNFGLFSDGRLIRTKKVLSKEAAVKKIPFGGFDAAVIASVVPALTGKLILKIKRTRKGVSPVIADFKNIPIKIKVDFPAQVGADRLVNALAVKELYGSPAVVIDLGSATTFDIVSARGEYLGGVIAPGISMSINALHEKTAKLPIVSLVRPAGVAGKNTSDAIVSGIVHGNVGMIKEVMLRISRECFRPSGFKVVLTGGYAGFIKHYFKNFIVDEDLTLKGLNIIYSKISRA